MFKKLLISVSIGIIIWIIPAPEGMDVNAWHVFAIFSSTIVAIVLKAMPIGAIAVLAITVTALTQVLAPGSAGKSITYALAGFSESVIWLIVIAFFIARSFIKTGLGHRISYIFIKFLGKRTLSLAYGLILSDLILSPAMPSNTARSGGIIYPILKAISINFGSEPEKKTQKKIGSFLIFTVFQCNMITSAMFLTAMAGNPLCLKIASDMGVQLTWIGWFIAGVVPGIVSLIIIPLVLYKIYAPEIKATPDATNIAKAELDKMGKISPKELTLIGIFLVLLILWIFGSSIGVSSTTAALVGVCLLLLTGVLEWVDITGEKGAWDTLIWFSALVMLANNLNRLGFMDWINIHVRSALGDINWLTAFVVLLIIYIYVHYLFASLTAHIAAFYGTFLALGIAIGVPPVMMALGLAFASNIMGGITHYASGPAPIFYGSNYIEISDWWRIGFILSVINIIIWIGVGSVWWKVLGLW